MSLQMEWHRPNLRPSGRGARQHHESAYAGAGMAHVRGQVLTDEGRLLASFTQDAMIRAFGADGSTAAAMPAEARL